MSRNKNSIPYSASDIAKYRKGELSAREMHDLEQAALDDPFLADAIEGFTQHPTLQQDFDDLHQRLNTKVADASRRRKIGSVPYPYRIALAATLILLLGIGYTFFYHYAGSPAKASAKAATPQLAPEPATVADNGRKPEPATVPSNAPATIPANAPAPEPATVARNVPTPAAQPPGTAALRHRLPASATNQASTSKALTSNQVPIRRSDKDSTQALQSVSFIPPANQFQPVPDSLTLANLALEKKQYKAIPLLYSGKVLDLQNHPLAGAFLALNGNNGSGTVTDDQGQFMLSLHPLDSTRQLTVSMIGYDRASLAVNTLSTEDVKGNVIHLRPSTANLDEVVVVGYGMHRKATEVAAPSESDEKLDTLWNIAAPVIGRQAYLQYLGVAKKKLGLDTTITGTETISFIVSRTGPLSSFKIEQSLSPAHDAGIIRLITDGPPWHLLRGKKVRASVTVNF